MTDPYTGPAGALLQRAEHELYCYQAVMSRAAALPWWRFRRRRYWLEIAEDHRLRGIALVEESERLDSDDEATPRERRRAAADRMRRTR